MVPTVVVRGANLYLEPKREIGRQSAGSIVRFVHRDRLQRHWIVAVHFKRAGQCQAGAGQDYRIVSSGGKQVIESRASLDREPFVKKQIDFFKLAVQRVRGVTFSRL